MRLRPTLASICLAGAAGLAGADTALVPDGTGGYWFGPQTRLRLQAMPQAGPPLRLGYTVEPALARPLGASLAGDYYFGAQPDDPAAARSGFRASSALLIRQGGLSLSDLAWSTRAAASFGTSTRLALPTLAGDPTAYSVSTLPYVGIGYSDLALKGGWGFWADVGLVVQSPGGALGLGRVLSGGQSFDDLLRELRLAPMVQLGVNYSF